ncbi:MAG TPA: asparagine synthase-related protein [Vicinamibacterales bacterium]|nr:asparagine synthase-related protein [Vicinamibacterales bacterium]
MTAARADAARRGALAAASAQDDWLCSFALDAPARSLPPGVPFTTRGPLSVFVEGLLFDRADLERALGARFPDADADLVAAACERWGEAALDRLRGRFVAVVVDRTSDRVLIARDPVGLHPLFYAEYSGVAHVATTPGRLLAQPGISRAFNLPLLADHLCRRYPDARETFFAAVRRLPVGYRASIGQGRLRLERVWDPVPADRPIDWATDEECRAFDEVFDRAVGRTLQAGRTAVFLSGGLDSGTIAAAATDLARRRSLPAPLALSLGLPAAECDERLVQAGVARALGLTQHLLDFPAALGSLPLLTQSLALTRRLSSPLVNAWMPPYLALARLGRLHGAETVLSGDGGDEWFAAPAWHAADLIARGDLAGWRQFARLWQQSEGGSTGEIFRALGWRYGVRPILGGLLSRVSPATWDRQRSARLIASDPVWVAPDPAIRAEQQRRAPLALGPAAPAHGFRWADFRVCLDDATTAVQLEETYELGQRAGVRFLLPYYDADLVSLACRMPPAWHQADGRLRGLQRRRLAARLPQLGVERRAKVLATAFHRETLEASRRAAIAEVGALSTLGDLGVVDAVRAGAVLADESGADEKLRFWDLLNLEAWARSHAASQATGRE